MSLQSPIFTGGLLVGDLEANAIGDADAAINITSGEILGADTIDTTGDDDSITFGPGAVLEESSYLAAQAAAETNNVTIPEAKLNGEGYYTVVTSTEAVECDLDVAHWTPGSTYPLIGAPSDKNWKLGIDLIKDAALVEGVAWDKEDGRWEITLKENYTITSPKELEAVIVFEGKGVNKDEED